MNVQRELKTTICQESPALLPVTWKASLPSVLNDYQNQWPFLGIKFAFYFKHLLIILSSILPSQILWPHTKQGTRPVVGTFSPKSLTSLGLLKKSRFPLVGISCSN